MELSSPKIETFLIFSLQKKKKKHCVKGVQIRSFFWSVFSCIQSEYRKILTRKNPYLDTFHALKAFLTFREIELLKKLLIFQEGTFENKKDPF